MTETRKRPSKAEREAAAAEEQAKEAAASGTVLVSWVEFGERKLTKRDWSSVNVDHDATEWTAKNRFTAPVSQEAAEYLLTEETGFKLTSELRKSKLAEMGINLDAELEGPTGPGGGGGSGSSGGAPAPSSTGSTSTSTVG